MKYQCLACKAADNCELSWKDPTKEYMNCTEFKAPPRTNADRIRSMTDEELADVIAEGFCSGRIDKCDNYLITSSPIEILN